MIYRLRYCNKDGVEARVDIQKGLATPVIDVEGTERPFILSYNNDKGDKSGMFLSSSADIEIYETPEFNIDVLKTSNETELSVTHYINNIVSWQGFIIPDFFSIEVRNNPVITMTASDRLGTLKNVTLSDLPSMISLRELAILCLNKTGLTLSLKTMADFSNGTGVNDFFNSKILTQRLSDTKGRNISCYDVLGSILTASNSFLTQRGGEWYIVNKYQHEIGSGELYNTATTSTNWSEVIHDFSEITVGGRRTIVPVGSSVGVYQEFGGGRIHPENYDFLQDLTGWNSVGGFVASIDNRKVDTFTTGSTGQAEYKPVYGAVTEKKYLVNFNEYLRNENPIYLESNAIPIFYSGSGSVTVSLDINAVGPAVSSFGPFPPAYLRVAIIATNGTKTKTLDYSGKFIDYPSINPPVFISQFDKGEAISPTIYKALSKGMAVSGALEVEDDLSLYSLKIRIYGGGGGRTVLINSVGLTIKSGSKDNPKGTIYKSEQGSNFTKTHDLETSIFGDYLTNGLNGYFYDYPKDDTSSLFNNAGVLTNNWTTPTDTEQLPLLQHISRQKARMFSVAHDLLTAEIEVVNFDPLAIFRDCDGKRYSIVTAEVDFFNAKVNLDIEQIIYDGTILRRDFIYSYFGDGEKGVQSIGGVSAGSGGGSTGGGLTPEQLEILSFWKKDPDNPNTIFTEMNAYSKLEISAYGAGEGGGSGGSDYERLDTWASYDSSKAGWVLSALLGNDLNTRVTAIDGRVTDLENSAGGGSVTSVGISVPTGLSVSNSPITSSGVIAIGLQTGYSIPTTAKQGQWDAAFTNNHTHSNKTVLDGITSSLVSDWNTAFTNNHTHTNKTVLDGITSTLISHWNTAYTNNHTHANKTQLDLITQSNIDVLAKLSIVNGNLQIDGNAYATGELSAYGAGDGGGGGGGIIDTVYGYGDLGQTFNNSILTDTFNAYTINQINTRLLSVESGSATTVNTTGTGNAITSISKAGTVITATKGLTFSLDGHTHAYLPLAGGTMSNTNLVTNLNADLLDGLHKTAFPQYFHYGTTSSGSGWYKIKLLSTTSWMAAITVKLYQSYGYDEIIFTGYQYRSNYWHSPNAILKTSSGTSITVHFGYDSVNNLWVAVPAGNYTGMDVHVTNGYIQVADWSKNISVTKEATLTGTIQKTQTIYRPLNYNENALSATKLQTARTIAGVSFDGTANIAIPFANLSSKPTTLAGYGITNAYTKTEVDTALALKLNKSVFDDLFEKVEVSTGVFAIKAKYSFYSTGEVSAYGIGSGGSGGSYERLDAWVDYDSTKSGWVLSALLGNELDTRVINLESGSALTVNTTGTGNAITSISKSGTVITADKGLTFSLSNHLHTGVYEPVFTKNTAFNKNFGTTAGTVAEGNHTHNYLPLSATRWANFGYSNFALADKDLVEDGQGLLKLDGWYNTSIGALSIYGTRLTILGKLGHDKTQLYFNGISSSIQYRKSWYSNGAWTALRTLWDSANFNPANYLPLAGGTLTGNLTAPTFIGTLTGNAASATKLQTARTIWGQSFKGDANVSGAMTGVTTLAMTGALSGATTIQATISVASPKVIFNSAGWSMEQVGSELQMKYNNVLKMRFTSTGSIIATEEITAFG